MIGGEFEDREDLQERGERWELWTEDDNEREEGKSDIPIEKTFPDGVKVLWWDIIVLSCVDVALFAGIQMNDVIFVQVCEEEEEGDKLLNCPQKISSIYELFGRYVT